MSHAVSMLVLGLCFCLVLWDLGKRALLDKKAVERLELALTRTVDLDAKQATMRLDYDHKFQVLGQRIEQHSSAKASSATISPFGPRKR